MMYISSLLCALCLALQAGISWTENMSGHTRPTQAKPAYNFHNKQEQHTAASVKGIINIDDETPQNDQVEGSGGSRDDTESGSGLGPDDEDGEGESGSGVSVSTFTNRQLTRCEQLRASAKNVDRGLIGAFLPVCKPNGDFKEEQCDTVQGQCWCVDRHGQEVLYTRKRLPNKPNCGRDAGDGVKPDYQTTKERDTKKTEKPEPEKETDQPTEPTPKSEPEKGTEKEFTEENDNKSGKDGTGTKLMTTNKRRSPPGLSSGILAGIIGGTIVGLLCAILLVLFIVYRMRKKDEGSYALDEPKHSPSMHSYQRAPAREFYA